MTRPNDDLTAEPLTDEEMAHLEAQLRRDVLRPRDTWLGLLARLRAAEAGLHAVRAQPKRDELAHALKLVKGEYADLKTHAAELEVRIQAAPAEVERLTTELRKTKALVGALEDLARERAREIADLTREVAALRAQAALLVEERIAHLRTQEALRTVTEEVDRARTAQEAAHAQFEHLTAGAAARVAERDAALARTRLSEDVARRALEDVDVLRKQSGRSAELVTENERLRERLKALEQQQQKQVEAHAVTEQLLAAQNRASVDLERTVADLLLQQDAAERAIHAGRECQHAAELAEEEAQVERDAAVSALDGLRARIAELEADEENQRLRETIQVLDERFAALRAKVQRLERGEGA